MYIPFPPADLNSIRRTAHALAYFSMMLSSLYLYWRLHPFSLESRFEQCRRSYRWLLNAFSNEFCHHSAALLRFQYPSTLRRSNTARHVVAPLSTSSLSLAKASRASDQPARKSSREEHLCEPSREPGVPSTKQYFLYSAPLRCGCLHDAFK